MQHNKFTIKKWKQFKINAEKRDAFSIMLSHFALDDCKFQKEKKLLTN